MPLAGVKLISTGSVNKFRSTKEGSEEQDQSALNKQTLTGVLQ